MTWKPQTVRLLLFLSCRWTDILDSFTNFFVMEINSRVSTKLGEVLLGSWGADGWMDDKIAGRYKGGWMEPLKHNWGSHRLQMSQNICFWRSDQFLLRLSCRDHGSRARLQQEAGGSVVCSVSGPTALPPGSHRGVLRSHQEEGGRNCMSRTSSALFQTFNWEICCIVCVSFCLFVSSWRCSRSAWLQTCSSSWPVSSRSLESTSPHLWVTWTTKTDHWSVCDPSNG